MRSQDEQMFRRTKNNVNCFSCSSFSILNTVVISEQKKYLEPNIFMHTCKSHKPAAGAKLATNTEHGGCDKMNSNTHTNGKKCLVKHARVTRGS